MIKKRWIDSASKPDILRMLKKLVPGYIYDKRTYLFNWDNISSDTEKESLLNRIIRIFNLDWVIHKNDKISDEITFPESKLNLSDFALSIRYGRTSTVSIAVHKESNEGILSLWRGTNEVETKELVSQKNDNQLRIYLKRVEKNKTRFLDVTLNEKIKDKHPLFNKYWEDIKNKEIHNLFDKIPAEVAETFVKDGACQYLIYNTTNFWKYKINIRGFLLYILAETMAERKNNKRFQDVVFSKSILKVAPFLLGHESMESLEFDTLKTLREIALEFQYQLDYTYQPQYLVTEKDEYLIYKVIESYKAKVDGFFNFMTEQVQKFILPTKIGYINYLSKRHKVIEYRLFMLDLLRTWTEKQSKKIDDEYEHFQGEYKRYPIA